MEYFNKAKAVKLRSHLGKYLVADEDNNNVSQIRNGTTQKTLWLIELVQTKPHHIRLRSHHGRYLTASDTPFLLGMTGNKVVQADYDAGLSKKYEWEPIKDGINVKLRSWCGKFLRGNGGTPPWRNSVTHDDPSSVTYNWILWGVEIVELSNHGLMLNQTSFASNSSFDSRVDVHDDFKSVSTSMNKTLSSSNSRHNSMVQASSNVGSALSNTDINANVKQDSLLNKLRTEYSLQNVLKALEEDSSKAFGYLSFLKKLKNPLTDNETLRKVVQLESVIDQYAKAVQKRNEILIKLNAQKHAYNALLTKAQDAQLELTRIQHEAELQHPRLKTCNNNISAWEANIVELQRQINDYKIKIVEEQTIRESIKSELSLSIKEKIDAKSREEIQAFDASEAIAEEVKILEHTNQVIAKEKLSLYNVYQNIASTL